MTDGYQSGNVVGKTDKRRTGIQFNPRVAAAGIDKFFIFDFNHAVQLMRSIKQFFVHNFLKL